MIEEVEARLFGLVNTNRDFRTRESWGKNQFNSSFPAALCCYLAYKNLDANYLCIKQGVYLSDSISINNLFGMEYDSDDIFYAFEFQHSPFQRYIIGSIPRTDLVIQRKSSGECLTGLEVKLTALPDNTTCDYVDSLYGSEIVVRPDSIVYLACSVASGLNDKLNTIIPDIQISDWTDGNLVLRHIKEIINTIVNISIELENDQKPFLIQPVWKTIGKSPILADNCLDVFVWSDAGFCHFISKIAKSEENATTITRQTRTAIWLFKMLAEIKINGHFNHKQIIDSLSYNTKNDKAFATAGALTNKFMTSDRLLKPAILKDEIKEIVLGGGQNLLSPERRFDAILFNTPDIFI